jgi:hypothetical protein
MSKRIAQREPDVAVQRKSPAQEAGLGLLEFPVNGGYHPTHRKGQHMTVGP